MSIWRLTFGDPGLGPVMHGSYEPVLVLMSVLVAILAGFAALSISECISHTPRGSGRSAWTIAGACAIGGGVWSMHFTAMLAFAMPDGHEMRYDLLITLASVVPGCIGGGVALHSLSTASVGWKKLQLCAFLMASGIGAMHYLGMEAMRMDMTIRYSASLFALSIIVAHLLSTVALYVGFMVRTRGGAGRLGRKTIASFIMGLSVAGMHYTGMAATRFYHGPPAPPTGVVLPPMMIGGTIFGVISLILIGAVLAVDISRRMRLAESAVRDSLARERSVLHAMLDGVILSDESGVIETVNPAINRMFGYEAHALDGCHVCDIFPEACGVTGEGAHEHPFAHRRASLDAVSSAPVELTGRTRTGEAIPVECSMSEYQSKSGRRLCWLIRDMTERKRIERHLLLSAKEARAASERADRASVSKSEFLANMSHEIRTPMTAILGYADLLDTDGELMRNPAESSLAIRAIRTNARHLLSIINDILDMSKIEAGRMTVERIDTNPAQIVEEIASLMMPRIQDKDIELRILYETPIPARIQSDPIRLRQILLNITGNAIKFTEAGAVTIHVSCDPAAGRMRFRVADTGVGMTPEQRDRIARFEAFTQADGSTTRRFGGSGLGLRISSSLTAMLGGAIAIDSERGVGSVFTIEIPTGDLNSVEMVTPERMPFQADDHTSAPPEPAPAGTRPLDGLRILLAEDGPDNQRLIAYHLKKAGAEVIIAENGLIAVEAVEHAGFDEPPHVVLMDMQMPELDGYGATRRLRRAGYAMPILALTAHAMAGDREKCLDAGCDDYLTKPIDSAALIAACAAWGTNTPARRSA